MKRLLLLNAFWLVLISPLRSQIFWTETFSSSCPSGCLLPYTGANGTWTWVSTGTNGIAANTWFVSLAEGGLPRGSCGATGFGNDASLHVGNVSNSPAAFLFCPTGDCGAACDYSPCCPDVTANARATSPVINCTGKSNITLSFNYLEDGLPGVDYATVYYFNGTSWALLATPTPTALTCSPQGLWTNYSVALPATANNNPSVQIGFNWSNTAGNLGNDPSFAVDSVSLSVPVVLPIQLLSFAATLDNASNQVNLQWSTATETNNAFFTIERSTDGESYSTLLTEKGAGNSIQAKNYSAIDPEILGGNVYYRLKQTDFDGHFTYSYIVVVNEQDATYTRVYPDPATSDVTVAYSSSEAGQDIINIYDCAGRQVASRTIYSPAGNVYNALFNISTLSAGMYIVQVTTVNGRVIVKKFVKREADNGR